MIIEHAKAHNDLVLDLKINGHITESEYKTYLVFAVSDLGREYLNMATRSVLLEEPMIIDGIHSTWHDGRRSVWRHIHLIIDKINKHLEGGKDDGSSNSREDRPDDRFNPGNPDR